MPALVFEAYDQALKGPAGSKPTPSGQVEAEQNYGLFYAYNKVKDMALLPAPTKSYQDYDTSGAALFTFIGNQNGSTLTPATITLSIQQPGETTATKKTYTPFMMNTVFGPTPVWPTVNLYGPPKTGTASQVSLYKNTTDTTPQCTNTVLSIFKTSQKNPTGNGQYVPPFSGGLWKFPNVSAPGCVVAPKDVNWGDGSKTGFAQNIFLDANF